jgi:sugar phosphate permease
LASLRATPNSETDADEYKDFGDHPRQKWRLILAVFLPFAAGYYLSFLFRTINASISPALASEFGLDAAKTGLLASVYFLVFAGVQIPIGVLLDRYEPRRRRGVVEFWRLIDGGTPRLERTNYELDVVPGPHTLHLVP